jgi:hypothetical protein
LGPLALGTAYPLGSVDSSRVTVYEPVPGRPISALPSAPVTTVAVKPPSPVAVAETPGTPAFVSAIRTQTWMLSAAVLGSMGPGVAVATSCVDVATLLRVATVLGVGTVLAKAEAGTSRPNNVPPTNAAVTDARTILDRRR